MTNAPNYSKKLHKLINENDNHYFYKYDQPITACYYHVMEKTNCATESMQTYAALRARMLLS